MPLKKAKAMKMGIALLMVLSCAILPACGNIQPSRRGMTAEEWVSGDYIIIKESDTQACYLVTEEEERERLFAEMSAPHPYLRDTKDVLSEFSLCVIEEEKYKQEEAVYRAALYALELNEPPRDLMSAARAFMDEKHSAQQYEFWASDPEQHQDLMERLRALDVGLFYYPYRNIDREYCSVTLYYGCMDMIQDVASAGDIGQYEVDHVFLPVAEALEDKNLLHKSGRVKLSYANYGREPHSFGRRVELLVKRPLTAEEVEELEAMMRKATGEAPYMLKGEPSGGISYTEKTEYPILLITTEVLNGEQLQMIQGEIRASDTSL